MFIFKKHIPRRTFLRGIGATLALPLLDSMLPAQTPLSRTAANPKTRFTGIYIPQGVANNTSDANGSFVGSISEENRYNFWLPKGTGTGWEISEILSPLEPLREYMTVVSGLEGRQAKNAPGESGGDHARNAGVFLTAAKPKRTNGSDVYVGQTLDQLIAQHTGQDTLLPSIELGIEDIGYTGICGYGYSCAYTNTISWRTPTEPLPMEIRPQVVFERLFGDGATPQQRLARKQEDRSILDSLTHDVARLQSGLGPSDRNRLNEYLEDIREIERRLQTAAKASSDIPVPEIPLGVPTNVEEHTKLMFDLQALAFMADITRVSTFMYGREATSKSWPLSGVKGGWHGTSHHGEKLEGMKEYAKMNKYHIGLLKYFADKLKATPDGDGNLLDHSLILYGSMISNSNVHSHNDVPELLLGKASGQFKGGYHHRFSGDNSNGNLLVTIANKFGIAKETFGDSTAKLDI